MLQKFDYTFSNDDMVKFAQDVYGIHASIRSLAGEYDHNFHLKVDDRAEYVLKIMHPDRTRDEIEFQIAMLDHLAETAPELPLPRVRPTSGGEQVTVMDRGGSRTTPTESNDSHLVWVLTYNPDPVLADVYPHSRDILTSLGAFLGRMDRALADFSHPAAERPLKWNLAQPEWIMGYIQHIEDPARCKLVESIMVRFEDDVKPAFSDLRHSVIHNDANDHNILVSQPHTYPRQVTGLIDFGDAVYAPTICNLAIACAYAVLDKASPLEFASAVIAAYHAEFRLTEDEIALIFPLICTRLAVSVTNSAYRKKQDPDDPYIIVSEAPAWAALEQLTQINPDFAHYTFRATCDLSPVPHTEAINQWLRENQADFAPLVDRLESSCVLDLSVGSLMLGANPAALERESLERTIADEMNHTGAQVAIGQYNEARLIYTSPAFITGDHPTAETRTIHLGLDIFAPPGTPVYAPLAGKVHCLANNTARLDYGPLIILEHRAGEHTFYTLYGHLSAESLDKLQPGQAVNAGERIATIGAPPTNGDWPPHLHFQIITDLLGLDHDFPGVALASQREVWLSLSPDPALITGNLSVRAIRESPLQQTYDETLAARRDRIGGSLSLSYRQPLKIVRGWMQYLYDDTGRAYLDMYNNVPHVGHSHPDVVRAAQQQIGLLTTNTRYLHDNITEYARRLTALMPDPLSVCFFVNSGSEANELALRLAYTHTGARNTIVLDAAYHGHTNTLIDISPYKFNGPGGKGAKAWVHVAPIPDDYRGAYRRDDPDRGGKYAGHVAEIITEIQAKGEAVGAFIAETLPSVGGQITPPPGYLRTAYEHVRAAGGICIADEVQVAFGRLGDYYWGFEMQDATPDIVVLGKPHRQWTPPERGHHHAGNCPII